MINLSYGGHFDEELLVHLLLNTGRDFIIQGQQACSLADHTKPASLDYWLRKNVAPNQDTKQANNEVMEALANTGLFAIEENLLCPDSGFPCKGLRLLPSS